MKLNRVWAMPNKWTFRISTIADLIGRYTLYDGLGWVDPFAGESTIAQYSNDITPGLQPFNMDALDFLKSLENNMARGVLFDPPYSEEQCLRSYKSKFKGTAGRAEYWARCKDEITRIIEPQGICISLCWDSCGIGKDRGFEIEEILLVCHGACHNDTIVTVERKICQPMIMTS